MCVQVEEALCVCYVWYATTDSEKLVDIVKEWLRYKETSGFVTRVHCELCSKHADRLKSLRNYLVHLLLMALQGVLRKHNIKHSKSDMHKKAVSIPRRPRTIDDLDQLVGH